MFGNVPTKKQLECVCPNCQRNLAASRFAPHLEKCMGMGRNSSRIASRRSQKALKENEARYITKGILIYMDFSEASHLTFWICSF